jgi:hypothetical protein
MSRGRLLWLSALLILGCPAWAGSIDTAVIERPWPKQRSRQLEVGRYPVRWRCSAVKRQGIFAGVGFEVPRARPQVWERANAYRDIGQMTPGVTAVRYLERSETRQVIQVDMKILWKTLTLTFEVEREPPRAVRFRLANRALGEYLGLCLFEETPAGTSIELATWLQPSRPVPAGLLLAVERMTMLRAAREFLETCEKAVPSTQDAGRRTQDARS